MRAAQEKYTDQTLLFVNQVESAIMASAEELKLKKNAPIVSVVLHFGSMV